MDPADVHWALTNQGARLGHHEQTISIVLHNMAVHALSFAAHGTSFLRVDSGADDYFVNENLARQAGIALSGPYCVFDLGGCPLARVTHRAAPVTLLVSGNHCQIELF